MTDCRIFVRMTTDAWIEGLEFRITGARHDDVLDAIDAARDEFGA